MTFISAYSPKWGNKAHTSVNITANFIELGHVPFTASASDTTEHGKTIWTMAVNGDFGTIAPWEEPPASPEQAILEAKAARELAVSQIIVQTSSGKQVDGNEQAQDRMARAVLAMTDTDELPWVLADNTVANITKPELLEALRLAGKAMAELWVLPYQQ